MFDKVYLDSLVLFEKYSKEEMMFSSIILKTINNFLLISSL